MNRFIRRDTIFLFIALICSAVLTNLTVTPPMIPVDWARLDSMGIYVPQRSAYHWPSYAVQVVLWLAMVAALWWATGHSIPQRSARIPKRGGHDLSRPSIQFGVMLITLLGFGLRLYSLNRLPLIVDEIGFAAHASDILHGQFVPIFAPGHNANSSTYSWLVAGVMAIFGQNAFAIRLLPVAFGTLTIPAAYILGREWWSKRVGFLAAAFVATYPAHVFFSRISLYGIVDPFFSMLALAFLAHAISVSKDWAASRQYYVLAGITAGIAQYFYHTARLVMVLMAIYVIVSVMRRVSRENLSLRESARSIVNRVLPVLWMVAVLILVILPRFGSLIALHLPITGNMYALRMPDDFDANVIRSMLAWVGQRDVSPFWLSDQPLLPLPALLAFLLGVWFCLRHWRDPRSVTLLLSLVLTTIFGGVILTASPLYVRYVANLPAIALLVVIGIETTFFNAKTQWKDERRGGSKTLPYIGILLMIVIVAYGSYISFFVHPAEAFERITAGQWEEDSLAQQAAHQPAGLPVVLEVSSNFGTDPYYGPLELLTIAHYVAAYGERRVLIVNRNDPKQLEQQMQPLGNPPYAIVQVNPP